MVGASVANSACSDSNLPDEQTPDADTFMPSQTDSGLKKIDSGTPVDSMDGGTAVDANVPCITTPPSNNCGVFPQCGCKTNETCDVDGDGGASSCVEAGALTLGRPCDVTSECEQGYTCEYSVCRPYCGKKQGDTCSIAGTGICVDVLDDNNQPIPHLLVCTVSCDPSAPTALCGAGNTCLWFASYYAPAQVTDCSFPGTVALGQSCTSDYDCVAGAACMNNPKKGYQCEQWCRLPAATYPTDCTGKTCTDILGANAPVINGVKEGTCE